MEQMGLTEFLEKFLPDFEEKNLEAKNKKVCYWVEFCEDNFHEALKNFAKKLCEKQRKNCKKAYKNYALLENKDMSKCILSAPQPKIEEL